MSKHLSLNDRMTIQSDLCSAHSLRQIARTLDRSVSVISREVKKHRQIVDTGAFGRIMNRCVHRNGCQKQFVCMNMPNCTRLCATCSKCNKHCPEFVEIHCPKQELPPYVCNGCQDKPSCVLRKFMYDAQQAQAEYTELLSSSRTGLNMTQEELDVLDSFVSPLTQNGQSINHIAMTQADALIRSSRTMYRLVHSSMLSAKSLDMPRVCRLKPRKARPIPLKVDKTCRIHRTYADYNLYISEHKEAPVVQMDSVIGRIGGKVLLTLHLTSFDFMLAILRDQNTARSVTDSLTRLRDQLTPSLFARIFPVLLTDNGSEFSNPSAIEFTENGLVTTRVFYCDPLASYQKPNIELNHEFIRRFLPKGSSFDLLSQQDVSLMMSNINSYARSKFGGLSPTQFFTQAYGSEALRLLGQALIPQEKIVLNHSIFCE